MSNDTRVQTILILAANPSSTSRLRLDEEVREIDEGLRRANKREQFKLEQKWAVRQRDFYRAILDYQPQIVHFSGHGVGEEGLVLEDETGQPALVKADALSSMFKLFATKGLACVLLNACYSDVQAEVISQHINYVIGMNSTVGDRAALAFAVAFYDAVAAGESVEFAYELGCSQMMHYWEHQTPVLKKRKHIAMIALSEEKVIPPNPYQGLFAFEEKDSEFFFGRETYIKQLVASVHRKQRLVAVIGSSGSGKTSIVFAGLIPRLRLWKKGSMPLCIISFRPGENPFRNLASQLVPLLETQISEIDLLVEINKLAKALQRKELALSDVLTRLLNKQSCTRLLLVADQFEELYTLCQDILERQAFLDSLLEATNNVTNLPNFSLLLTLRADFIGYALSYRQFADALQNADVKLGSMNSEELRAAIEKPAIVMGVQIEPGLTERLLKDVGKEPGNLPLLEFALTQLWQKQSQGQLAHKAYFEIGGVEKALAVYAEEIYNQLNKKDKQIAQRVLIQLVHPGEGTEDTRQRATRAEVGEDNWDLVKRLADARLVVTGRDEGIAQEVVEIVHEALIREWVTLKEWMNANRQFRTWQERLKIAVDEWKNSNNDSGVLLRGVPLAVAEEWLQKRSDELTKEEKNFIAASIEQQVREKQEQQRRQRRIVLGLSSGLLITLGLAGAAGWQWQQSEIAQIRTIIKSSRFLFESNKQFEVLIETLKAGKILKRMFWVKGDVQTEVIGILRQAISEISERNRLEGHENSVWSVVFSFDGKTLASASADKTIKLWDISTGKPLRTFKGHGNTVHSVVFSPDGKTLASASSDNTVKLWDTSTGKPLRTFKGHGNTVYSIVFSPDGKTLASASEDKTIKLWNVSTGKLLQTLKGHRNKVWSIVSSPDGKTLASASEDKTIKLWDVSTGKPLQTFKGHSDEVNSIVFSPNGKTLASASSDKTVKLWNISTGKSFQTFEGHLSNVYSVAFSPDGKTLASASHDKTIKLWDINSGLESKTLTGHDNFVSGISFSSDGKTLASASGDYTIKLWNVGMIKERNILIGHRAEVYSVAFSHTNKILASASRNHRIGLWDTVTGQLLHILEGHQETVWSVVFSSDDKTLASAGRDYTIKLWNVTTGKLRQTLKGHTDTVNSIAFNSNSKILASASADDSIKLWDTKTGLPLYTFIGHSNDVQSIVFSPDGKTLASASADSTIKLWNINTGKPFQTLKGHKSTVYGVAFSPDGKTLASASADSTIKLWNINTGTESITLTGHSNKVYSVAFSPDGKTLASASADSTIKLWNINTSSELTTLKGHADEVNSVVFSSDGKTLASGSDDNKVILWNLAANLWYSDLNYLLVRGCNWIHDYTSNRNDENSNFCNSVVTQR